MASTFMLACYSELHIHILIQKSSSIYEYHNFKTNYDSMAMTMAVLNETNRHVMYNLQHE